MRRDSQLATDVSQLFVVYRDVSTWDVMCRQERLCRQLTVCSVDACSVAQNLPTPYVRLLQYYLLMRGCGMQVHVLAASGGQAARGDPSTDLALQCGQQQQQQQQQQTCCAAASAGMGQLVATAARSNATCIV
jgi:hypothetical protein